MIKIRIIFFASFKEVLECSETSLELESGSSIKDLCDLLADKGSAWAALFTKPTNMVKIACNQQMTDLNRLLSDGDEVAFFPPVTGG